MTADRTVVEHGSWRVVLSLGEVGHIAFDGIEVVRAVRVVGRDADWNTWPHRTAPPTVVRDADGVTVGLQIEVLDDDGTSLADATVSVRLDAACTVTAEIRPLRPLTTNRLGIVVLHPPTLAGSALTVAHPDGSTDATRFPEHIAPHQPAADIRALGYAIDGLDVGIALDGDVFEMEDQRNWTDASFKTYGRPLALPFPYRVEPSETVRQAVRITVGREDRIALDAPVAVTERSGPAARASAPGSASVPSAPGSASVSSTPGPAPVSSTPGSAAVSSLEIGTSSGRHVDGPLPPKAPNAGPLLVELTADRSSWSTIVDRAALEADALGVPVDLRIVAADAEDLHAGLLAADRLHLARVGVFDPVTHVTERPVWDALRRWRDGRADTDRRADTDGRAVPLPLVAGTRAHFTELNRTIERLPRDADLVAFSITPTMHATDPEHVEESLAMQSLVARDAVTLADGIPVVVGPVTLRRRFNAVATTPSPGSVVEAERGTDPTMSTETAASWFVRSVEALAVPGVLGGSWFEATGPRGLVDADGHLTPVGECWVSLVS